MCGWQAAALKKTSHKTLLRGDCSALQNARTIGCKESHRQPLIKAVVIEALAPHWSHGPRRDPAPVAPNNPDFDAIYEQWFDDVNRWVRAMGGPLPDREDLVQDVFLVAHRRLKDFDGANVGGWLYQIARRRVRDYRRLRWVKSVLLRRAPLSEAAPLKGPGPADTLETKEKRRVLEHLLEKLNQTERAALVLFEIEGYSGQEIARIQGVPLNTVWARIHKARKKLRSELGRLNGETTQLRRSKK